jgi:hypothetical protein
VGDGPEIVANGQYAIPKGVSVICLLGRIQRDPEVFGEDAESFKPERMLKNGFDRLPNNAWKVGHFHTKVLKSTDKVLSHSGLVNERALAAPSPGKKPYWLLR